MGDFLLRILYAQGDLAAKLSEPILYLVGKLGDLIAEV
jgi:hypothetical protein